MKKITIQYPMQLSTKLVEEFEKKIYYISEGIESFQRIYDGSTINGVELLVHEKCNEKDIKDRVFDIIENEIIGLKNIKVDKIWDDDIYSADSEKVLRESIEKKLVVLPNDGQITIKEPLVSLFEFFDNVFKNISEKIFYCENYQFPTLLKISTLRKAGYFDSFPNLLMLVSRLKNEIDNYLSFKREFASIKENTNQKLLEYCIGTEYGLPPTMCYYVYEMFSGQVMNNISVTAKGKSFRYENRYYKPFERLWDFTIRETVFLGKRSYVSENVKNYRSCAIKFMRLIEVNGSCESASDPFFLTGKTSKKINVQKMMGSKYELRLCLGQNRTIAAGSFNIHGQYLSKRFQLFENAEKDQYCYTGCIGIGIERMLFAFISQYGVDKSKWPEIVRKGIDDPSSIQDIIQEIENMQ